MVPTTRDTHLSASTTCLNFLYLLGNSYMVLTRGSKGANVNFFGKRSRGRRERGSSKLDEAGRQSGLTSQRLPRRVCLFCNRGRLAWGFSRHRCLCSL